MNRINRRGLLKRMPGVAGAIALGSLTTRSQTRAGEMAATAPRRGPNEEIRVACVGLNGQGSTHARAYARIKDVAVAALCDVDERVFAKNIAYLKERGRRRPDLHTDVRRLLEDKSIDAISVATPDHWHALATIWACQAGKDVYVEKPASHNVSEGRRMVEAALKHNRIVQVGFNNRSNSGTREAIEFLHSGKLGRIYMARALCYKWRASIGTQPDSEPPPGVHYDLWLGPAPRRRFNLNRFHYNWHWFWDYGTTDMGNQGVHQMDIARWGLNRTLPTKAYGAGGRFAYKDQAETPNTQVSTFTYPDGTMLVFEVRGWITNSDADVRIGNVFYGSEGYMVIGEAGDWATFMGEKREPGPSGKGSYKDHWANFVEAVRSRSQGTLTAPVLEGHYSAALCHLGNISYRLGREVRFDPKTETFGNDQEANRYLTREYRSPFVVPQQL